MTDETGLPTDSIRQLPDRAIPRPPGVLSTNDRITTQILLHHESDGKKPIMMQSTFSGYATVKEQPYQRYLTAGSDFQPLLEGCWVKGPGMVVIRVAKPAGRFTNPADEIAACEKRSLEILSATGCEFAKLRGGAWMAFEIHPNADLQYRSLGDSFEFEILVLSR